MTKKNLFVGLVTLGVAIVMLTSCGKEPQEEISAAKTAIENAKTAGAELYMVAEFAAVQSNMDSVMNMVEAEKAKMFPNYKEVNTKLTEVSQTADQINQQVSAKKEEIKTEIQNTIAEVKSLIKANNQLISEMPANKETSTTIATIKSELSNVEIMVNEINVLIEQGDYITSLDKVKTSKEKVNSINSNLKETLAKQKTTTKGKKA